MKKYYWFILLFVVWIIASALWYLFGVKGVVNADPHYFSPHIRLLAIIEIFMMLLGACLLGYGVGWWLRQETIDRQGERTEELLNENYTLQTDRDELKNQISLWQDKHRHDLEACHQKLQEAHTEKENLQERYNGLEISLAQTRQEYLLTQSQQQQLENEAGTVRYKSRQLEYQNKELEEANRQLKAAVEELQSARREKSVSEHPFVRPVEPDEKDDLTKIKGIGPFIEKRLNMIGIYTFGQLAELSPEMIERVGAAIEFFPHRIQRDNWVGQAKRLME
ncbi:MAG: hypothetical protein JST43_00780 [Bacteroidetes bacterium]|nr:hypothetical protein [Bacteroidota bacterium]MBS1540708.1 hypothetical protein [Bacteroidota bacterium]